MINDDYISTTNSLQGSIALHEYLGWEAGFTLEKESQTLALVLKESLIVFAFDNRETLMRWQVRLSYHMQFLSCSLKMFFYLQNIIYAIGNIIQQVRVTSQFEEGQHFLAHMIQLPNKSKLPSGQVRVHVQNRRFSLTHGVPPKLVHSWDLVDLR